MTSPTSFIEIVENRIMSNAARLPVFNTTAARIQQEIGREEPDLRLIEKLIVSDQALTAEVLRFSNSSFYKGLTQVSTVRNAIVRLGINEVSNIVMMVTHENQFRSKDPVLNGVIRKLWQHARGTAMAAHWLARHCGLHGIAHEAFFAGLLHDVGKLFILTVIDDIQHSDQVKVNPSAALLMEVMDDLHTTHGYALMHHWNLPEKYSQVVRDHHTQALEAENYLVPHGAAGEQNLQQNGARTAARCRHGAHGDGGGERTAPLGGRHRHAGDHAGGLPGARP